MQSIPSIKQLKCPKSILVKLTHRFHPRDPNGIQRKGILCTGWSVPSDWRYSGAKDYPSDWPQAYRSDLNDFREGQDAPCPTNLKTDLRPAQTCWASAPQSRQLLFNAEIFRTENAAAKLLQLSFRTGGQSRHQIHSSAGRWPQTFRSAWTGTAFYQAPPQHRQINKFRKCLQPSNQLRQNSLLPHKRICYHSLAIENCISNFWTSLIFICKPYRHPSSRYRQTKAGGFFVSKSASPPQNTDTKPPRREEPINPNG